jgi:serine/threonine-protein kinase
VSPHVDNTLGTSTGAPAPALGLEPGALLDGRYRVEKPIGRGGMATVYRGHDEKLDVPVAIKASWAEGAALDATRARFEREAHIGARLGGEAGYVQARDFGELPGEGLLYLVMELVDGAEPLDLRSTSLEERLDQIEHLLERVAGLHARGIVHRDLKPSNVLIRHDQRVLLADFGLARFGRRPPPAEADPSAVVPQDDDLLATLVTQAGGGVGTPPFMPPEQFEDPDQADARADVYALGVILFLALTGRYPYGERDCRAELERVARGETPAADFVGDELPASTPPGLPALCLEALALDPDARPRDAESLLGRFRLARRPPADGPPPLEDQEDQERLEAAYYDARARLTWGHDLTKVRADLLARRLAPADVQELLDAIQAELATLRAGIVRTRLRLALLLTAIVGLASWVEPGWAIRAQTAPPQLAAIFAKMLAAPGAGWFFVQAWLAHTSEGLPSGVSVPLRLQQRIGP